MRADAGTRTTQLVAALQDRKRKRQFRIQALGEMWEWATRGRHPSCFLLQRPANEPPTAAAVSVVSSFVQDPDANIRLAVVVALGWSGEHAGIAEPALVCALGDSHVPVRINAARSLAGQTASLVARISEPAREALVDLLDDQVWTVRWHAVRALAGACPTEQLLGVLERSVPRRGSFSLDEWLRAALSLGDAGKALIERVDPGSSAHLPS